MIIKNNIIRLPRGESAQFAYVGVQKTGEPYILPPKVHEGIEIAKRVDYAVLALTVTTGVNGDVVLEKYYDLEAPPMYKTLTDGKIVGVTDNTEGGYHKFTQTTIEEFTSEQDALKDWHAGNHKIYKTSDGDFVHVVRDSLDKLDVAPYEFRVILSLEHEDTVGLEAKEYLYDLTVYFGELTDAEVEAMNTGKTVYGFPLKRIAVKDVLIKPQKFILEDSNNV